MPKAAIRVALVAACREVLSGRQDLLNDKASVGPFCRNGLSLSGEPAILGFCDSFTYCVPVTTGFMWNSTAESAIHVARGVVPHEIRVNGSKVQLFAVESFLMRQLRTLFENVFFVEDKMMHYSSPL